jgi:hypothetical protein
MAPFDAALGVVHAPVRIADIATAIRRPPVVNSLLVVTIVLLSVRSVKLSQFSPPTHPV